MLILGLFFVGGLITGIVLCGGLWLIHAAGRYREKHWHVS